MSALSSGFFSDQARADAGSAFESALQDLKEKYERKAEEEAAAAAEAAKEDIDSDEAELEELMRDPELERIRAKRMAQLKAQQESTKKHMALGHGRYREITEDEFLPEVTKSRYVICHFYHREFLRCKIMDKHLRKLAQKYYATKFVYINAEKARFFVGKLNVKTLPTLIMFEDGVAKDRLIGFDGLGEDDFPTKYLIRRLKMKGILRKREPTKEAPEDDPDDTDDEDLDEVTVRKMRTSAAMRIAVGTDAGEEEDDA